MIPDEVLASASRVRAFLDRRVEMGGTDPKTLFALDGGRYTLEYHDLRTLIAFAEDRPINPEPYRTVQGETEPPEIGVDSVI